MFSQTALLALAAASVAQAASPQGFNYGNMMNGVARTEQDFEQDFAAAQKLSGAPGTFNAARLYTMLEGNSQNLIPALAAAKKTQTYLLLGLWASVDQSTFQHEIDALSQAAQDSDLTQYILGISVGSEDLYRISPTGLSSPGAAVGQEPDTLVDYIKQARKAIAGTAWSNIKVGHVDTWTAWVNGTNADVIANSDFLGVDAYPYWQTTQDNSVSNGKSLFDEAYHNTQGVAGGKEVWLTETGWAVTGPSQGKAQSNVNDAQQYWDDVGCAYFGTAPTFWYTLFDGIANSSEANAPPSFSIADHNMQPLFDLSCSNVVSNNETTNSTSTTGPSSGSSTATGSSSTGTGSSGSGASNGTYTGSPSQPSGTGSSGSGSSGSGSSGSHGSGSTSASAGAASGTGISTSGAASLSFSLGSMAALAAAVVALL